MMATNHAQQYTTLARIARRVMLERGFQPDFTPRAVAELNAIPGPATDAATRDLRGRLWCSIDNDDSRDLDQLTLAEARPGGAIKILVAVAEVDALVKQGSPLDDHAQHNTTSIYTAAQIFPMLPTKLSTDLTSLNDQSDRLAIVVEIVIDAGGALTGSSLYRATVRNQAKLAYNSVGAWLEGRGPMPAEMGTVKGLADNLRLQDQAAQKLKAIRQQHGALSLETIESHPVFEHEDLKRFEVEQPNRAKYLIEDFMIAANGVTARYLASKSFPSLRRVLRTPKRWDRIVALAAEHRYNLPATPDSKALEAFLVAAKAADAERFPDLSLSIIKLLGAGEYVVERPGADAGGHFGLAVEDYAHSTAPNRRYPDLITQRLLKAALAGAAPSYTDAELDSLAQHCTEKEDDARKVERQVAKSAAALMLESKIGQQFDAIVTGASDKGTWVRLTQPPVEGKLVSGFEGLDVGRRLRVQLARTDVEHGYIDFVKVKG
jgi:VacB/RNase II family 3'-5' exoribonuclease